MKTKRYKNIITGQEIIVYPWTSKDFRIMIENNPEKYLELFEES